MAPNRVADLPPVISSDEDISDDGTDEESEESSSDGNPALVPPSVPVIKKSNSKKLEPLPAPQPFNSPSDSDSSGSDSRNGTDTSFEKYPQSLNPPSSNVKPLSSKSLVEKRIEVVKPKVKKSKSKPEVPSIPTKPSTATKRPIEDTTNAKNSKRLKKKVSDLTSNVAEEKLSEKIETPKKSSQRDMWSNDDEVAILRAMVAFKGTHASTDMNLFYDFIKGNLRDKFSRNQVSAKIKRLRWKFKNNSIKGEALELSKKLWGGGETTPVEAEHVTGNGNIKSHSKASKAKELITKVNATPEVTELLKSNAGSRFLSEMVTSNRNLCGLNLNEDIMKEGLNLMESSKKSELEEKWKKMLEADMDLYFKRLDLIIKSTEEILVALSSPNN